MIRENPLLGSGPGTFPLHYATTGYAKAFSANRKIGDLYRRAHNTYLEIFSELGIPAGLLFVGMLGLGLYNLIRARRGVDAARQSASGGPDDAPGHEFSVADAVPDVPQRAEPEVRVDHARADQRAAPESRSKRRCHGGQGMSRISIVIPMYNEARHIGRTLLAAQKAAHAANLECELIVVDNGSNDQGPHIARQFGAQVLVHAGLADRRPAQSRHGHRHR